MSKSTTLLSAAGMAALLIAATPSTASAAPIYTCPGGSSECEGQTFALFATELADGWDVSVSINTTGYTGSEGDLANGVEFKNVFDSNVELTGITLVAAPGNPGLWAASVDQLSQDCDGADKADQGCAIWAADANGGFNFTIGDTLTWTFRITTEASLGNGTGHIKYRYVDEEGKQVAGLLSQDIPLQTCIDGRCEPPAVAPEPGSLMLLGSGLIFGARRLRQRLGR